MKITVKEKILKFKQKYVYYSILAISIFILFVITSYLNNGKSCMLYINDEYISTKYDIYTTKNIQYMHLEDVTDIFEDYVFYDKISGKLIVTKNNIYKKIAKDNTKYFFIKNNDVYINLRKLIELLEENIVITDNNIFIHDYDYLKATVKANRVEMFNITEKKIEYLLNKNSNVKIVVNETLLDDNIKFANVVLIKDSIEVYGKVLKNNLIYEYNEHQNELNTQKQIIVRADDSIKSTTDVNVIDIAILNMLRLSGENKIIKQDVIFNKTMQNVDVYACINNGQKAANYDSSIITGMLNSTTNREAVIQNLIQFVIDNDLAGIFVDFSDFNNNYKKLYTQFIKELTAMFHEKDKKVIINIPSLDYIDVNKISNIVDYVVVPVYAKRSLASKTSGATAPMDYVENLINKVTDTGTNLNKVILEVSTYSVLWTERKGTVISAENYSMKLAQEYIKTNGIQTRLDEVTNQNCFNYTKGATTYKMWLEDEYSINEKASLVNKYNLAGICIYKSGIEDKNIYQNIKEILN